MKTKIKAPIIALSALGVLAAAFFGVWIYTGGLDPNVDAAEIAPSGDNGAQPGQAPDAVAAGRVAATVVFPDGSSFTVTGSEAGFFGGGDSIDEELIRALAEEHGEKFNAAIPRGIYTIDEDGVNFVKGAGLARVDTEDICAAVAAALYKSLDSGAPETVNIVPPDEVIVDIPRLLNSLEAAPVDAAYDILAQSIIPEKAGHTFDAELARSAYDAASFGETVKAPFINVFPELTAQALEDTLFRDVLAETITKIGGYDNRHNNITLVSAEMNGCVLNPGDVFSFNEVVGQRTAARGFKAAGAYVGGRVVDEIGGGICQASSTLYNTVLHSNLKVVDRSNHYFIITYLPLGHDATVSWGGPDFKFENDTPYPIKIEAFVDKLTLTMRIYGTKTDDLRYETEYVQLDTSGYREIHEESARVQPGGTKVESPGHPGYVVETYMLVYDGLGELTERRFVSKSSYHPQNRVILYPIGSLDANGNLLPAPEPELEPEPVPEETPAPSPEPEPVPAEAVVPDEVPAPPPEENVAVGDVL
ncbi:MAG: VanW family protein [Oscillospiraceae bacterium]|nr:VanW family protein [Oscillospiraceae bacterium]